MEKSAFDVIVGDDILSMREAAKSGDLYCMARLGSFIQIGFQTRKNEKLALEIYDYVLSQREKISRNEILWGILNAKIHLHADREEYEIVDQICIDLIQDVTSHPPESWDHQKILSAAKWLHDRKTERDNTLNN